VPPLYGLAKARAFAYVQVYNFEELFALIRSQILDLMLHEARDQVTYHSSKPFGLLLNFFYFFIFSDLYMFLHSLSSGSNNFFFLFSFAFHSYLLEIYLVNYFQTGLLQFIIQASSIK